MKLSKFSLIIASAISLCLLTPQAYCESKGLQIKNGWFTQDEKVIWGNAQHNGWWQSGQQPNITRNAPDDIRPNRTEDLDKLTDNMLKYGYPGFEHNYGLWFDRRRDAHDEARRTDANVKGPFLEQPWQRSNQGQAWDGLAKYDLTKFNPWYFNRLKEFADLCDKKGTILFFNFYMQHNLLETPAHYVDFPWRDINCIQKTDMPDRVPAASAFYDIANPVRRQLHEAYIRHCLDQIGNYGNVVFLVSVEYTGPESFVKFWLDTIEQWQNKNNKKLIVALNGTKDVLDKLAGDRRVSVLDLRYFWYKSDGSLMAPTGGKELPVGYAVAKTTPQQIYRQVKQYRLRYPQKAIIHQIDASRQQTMAFFMGGGSMLVRYLNYPKRQDPPTYIAPENSKIILPIYNFINKYLTYKLAYATPQDNIILSDPQKSFCLGRPQKFYLIYTLTSDPIKIKITNSISSFYAQWLNTKTGKLTRASENPIKSNTKTTITSPGENDRLLYLSKID